jgi:hypothetical protein
MSPRQPCCNNEVAAGFFFSQKVLVGSSDIELLLAEEYFHKLSTAVVDAETHIF